MIKDSGNRREFDTGAVRDMAEGKGRCDLLPLDVCSDLFAGHAESQVVLNHIRDFETTGDSHYLSNTIRDFWFTFKRDSNAFVFDDGFICDMLLEVSIHFEEGAKKYGENNWQKGLPASCYIDSAVRHFLKFLRGDTDERHDRAFVWNLMCCIWTCKHKPELNTYKKQEVQSDEVV